MTKHALGLPENSVKAILAIIITIGFFFGCYMEWETGILAMILGLDTLVIKEYFSKQKSTDIHTVEEKKPDAA